MVGLIDARSPEVYKLLTANKRSDTSPISAESWTAVSWAPSINLVHPPESAPDVLPGRFNLPTRHQLLSDQLQSGQVIPPDIAVPPGPGGRFRNMNITFQRSNEQKPVYELPPIHTLATTVQKNISNMNVQSSPGFDPSSTSFIKHAEKTIQDDRGKRHWKCSASSSYWLDPSVPVRRCHPTSLEQSQNCASARKRSSYVPQKWSFAGYQW